jgi:hypothetical protein
MHGGIVREFRQKQELGPVILLVVAEVSKVLFLGSISLLRLAVCLGMECSRESVTYAHVTADSSPEWAGEMRAAVRDNVIRYAVFADPVLEQHPCQLWSVNIFLAGHVNHHLS